MGGGFRSAAVAFAAMAACVALPAAAQAGEGALLGFHGATLDNKPLYGGQWSTGYSDSQIAPLYRRVNAGVARMGGPWFLAQPSQHGAINWESFITQGELVHAARSGVKPIAVIASAPFWANPRNTGCLLGRCGRNIPPSPLHYGSFTDFVRKAALNYAGKLAAIEIWNEPNLHTFFAADSAPSYDDNETDRKNGYPLTSAEFARVMCAGYDGVRQAAAENPAAAVPVLLGGLSGSPNQHTNDSDAARFLRAVYDRLAEFGRTECFDAIGVHPYSASEPAPASPPQTQTGLTDFQLTMDSVRRAAADKDRVRPDRHMWITEVGYSTHIDRQTLGQQCKWTVQMVDWVMRTPGVDAIVIHRLKDAQDPMQRLTFRGYYGLLEVDAHAKPAYTALENYRNGKAWLCPPI